MNHVIQIHSGDIGGGAEAVVRQHHEQMLSNGIETQLLVGRKLGNGTYVDQIPFRKGPKGLLRAARWLERTFGLQNVYSPSFRSIESSFAFSPDIIHIHSLHGCDSFADLAVLPRLSKKFPTVLTLHDLWLMTGHCGHPLDCERWKIGCGSCPDLTLYPSIPRDATRWNFLRRKAILKRSKLHLVVPSAWLKSQIEMSPILGEFNVSIISNPVNTERFFPASRLCVRRKLGLSESDQVVLMIAQHLENPFKGIPDGVDALNRVEVKDLKVLLVGHDAGKVAEKIRHQSVVAPFTSDTNDLADYYRAADLLLMPSRGETFGLVAAEAMACGAPVVCPAVGGLTDVVGANEGGVLTPPRDSQAMAAAITELLRDDTQRQSMADSGVRRVQSLFTLRHHTDKVLRLYEQVRSEHFKA